MGLNLDRTLTRKNLVSAVCVRLSRTPFLLRKLRREITTEYLRNVYFAFFWSYLMYGLYICEQSPKFKKILLLQKKAVRILTNSEWLAPCKPSLFQKMEIMRVVDL